MTAFVELSSFRIGTFDKPNRSAQDRLFVYKSPTENFIALCIIDGHGIMGGVVANIVLNTLHEICSTTHESFFATPHLWLTNAFELANNKLSELNGGATCTLCIIVNSMLYIAYVGDSSVLLMTQESILDSSIVTTLTSDESTVETEYIETECLKTNCLLFCDDHSPENPDEYQRMLSLNPRIKCVYDRDGTFSKYALPSINKERRGIGYYKNVRSEPATLVVKENGRALAMTRSLGDFELKPEVTYVPTIQCINLTTLIGKLCLIVASDGVWDNWKYHEIQEFFTDETTCSSDIVDVANAFCDQNDIRATQNFGESKDDVSGIVVYF